MKTSMWLCVAAVLATTGCKVTKRSELCVAENDGKTVSAIGYVAVGGFSLISGDEFPIHLQQSMQAEEHVSAYIKLGDGANTMSALPEGDFSTEDIELHLVDGSDAGYGDRIEVTGKLTVNEHTCAFYDVDTIASP